MITHNTVSSDTFTIYAPVELVWQVLIDFKHYAKWNPFCPSIKAELTLGTPVEMLCDLGQGPYPQTEFMCEIEPNQAIAWRMENKPGDPIHAVRTQRLTKIDAQTCQYISVDEFSGVGMAGMINSLGQAIETGFNRCAIGLKQRAELLHAETQ